MFFTAFVLCILRLFKLKQKVKQYTEMLIAKLQNSNPNFSHPELAQSGFQQQSPGTPLLGLA